MVGGTPGLVWVPGPGSGAWWEPPYTQLVVTWLHMAGCPGHAQLAPLAPRPFQEGEPEVPLPRAGRGMPGQGSRPFWGWTGHREGVSCPSWG